MTFGLLGVKSLKCIQKNPGVLQKSPDSASSLQMEAFIEVFHRYKTALC